MRSRVGGETRRISDGTVRSMLNAALDDSGLRGAAGQPPRYTPHDFRRLFITDAILTGLSPMPAVDDTSGINTRHGHGGAVVVQPEYGPLSSAVQRHGGTTDQATSVQPDFDRDIGDRAQPNRPGPQQRPGVRP
jgi:hypothetical protein